MPFFTVLKLIISKKSKKRQYKKQKTAKLNLYAYICMK